MIEAMHSAVAGLRVSAQRLGVAAENIVNARTSGRLEPYDGYVPQRLVQTTDVGGAPRATVRDVAIPSFPAYAPSDPAANAKGVIGMPNVSLPSQFVELSVARRSYEANVAVLQTTQGMMKILIDREV